MHCRHRAEAKRFIAAAVAAAVNGAAATATAGVAASGADNGAAAVASAAPASHYGLLRRDDLLYDETKPLSSVGSFKTVFKGTVATEPSLGEVAVSVFKAAGSSYDTGFLDEVAVLNQLDHPNVLPLLGVCLEGRSLVTPLMPRDLFNALHNEPKAGFSGATRLRIMREVVLGLEYIHGKRIEHRDLKSSNVLLDAGNHAKLIDFGLARLQAATVASTKAGGAGVTPVWMAPKRLKKAGQGDDEAAAH